MEKYEEVLVSIRQIIRAIDLHSKKLSKESGLTAPQLILMRAISELNNVTIKQLSSHTNMSQATATTILDRLERNQLVERRRSVEDKRKVHAVLTEKGQEALKQYRRHCKSILLAASKSWKSGNRACFCLLCSASRP